MAPSSMGMCDEYGGGQYVLAPRLHTHNFQGWLKQLDSDEWVRHGKEYGDGDIRHATGSFTTIKEGAE